ncbi:MAG: hypothetical protein M3Q49_03005 [Actinomycetota bacterium]|nr:hypothetical protein [Actinomycetota bacterium]
MNRNMRVDDLAAEVLNRQAKARAKSTGEPLETSLGAVLETEAGRQLEELRDGPHGDESAPRWQEDLRRERAEERADEPGEGGRGLREGASLTSR